MEFLIIIILKQLKTNHINVCFRNNEWFTTVIYSEDYGTVKGRGETINKSLIDLQRKLHIVWLSEKNRLSKKEKDVVSWVFNLYNFLK